MSSLSDYIAILLIHGSSVAISDQHHWEEYDGAFDYAEFYNNVVDYFEFPGSDRQTGRRPITRFLEHVASPPTLMY
jgi:hypothetical protein